MKALHVRVRQAPRHAIDETLRQMPKPLRRRGPSNPRLDAEKLRKLWRDPQKLKQILGESDPD